MKGKENASNKSSLEWKNSKIIKMKPMKNNLYLQV